MSGADGNPCVDECARYVLEFVPVYLAHQHDARVAFALLSDGASRAAEAPVRALMEDQSQDPEEKQRKLNELHKESFEVWLRTVLEPPGELPTRLRRTLAELLGVDTSTDASIDALATAARRVSPEAWLSRLIECLAWTDDERTTLEFCAKGLGLTEEGLRAAPGASASSPAARRPS